MTDACGTNAKLNGIGDFDGIGKIEDLLGVEVPGVAPVPVPMPVNEHEHVTCYWHQVVKITLTDNSTLTSFACIIAKTETDVSGKCIGYMIGKKGAIGNVFVPIENVKCINP